MKSFALAAIMALVATSGARAAVLTPTEIVNRHMAAAAKGDVDAIMADYAEDAVALQSGRASQGKAEIRKLFEAMFPKKPAGSASAASGPKMTVTRVWEEGSVGFVTWEMGPVKGADEFLVKDGKIAVQAVFIGAPSAPAK